MRTRERLFSELEEEAGGAPGRARGEAPVPGVEEAQGSGGAEWPEPGRQQTGPCPSERLERMPKVGEEFSGKVAELRKAFQQHVRDEKRELLPAVSQALSEEEAQVVVERIEAGRADVEQAKREEAERQRAEARREREEVERQKAEAEEAERQEAAKRRAEARHQREEAERQRAESEEAERQEAVRRRTEARRERE